MFGIGVTELLILGVPLIVIGAVAFVMFTRNKNQE